MIRWPLLMASLFLSIWAFQSWQSLHSPKDPFFMEQYATEESAVPKLVRVKAHRLDKSPERPMRSIVQLSGTVLNNVPPHEWEKFRGVSVFVNSSADFMKNREFGNTVTYFGLERNASVNDHIYGHSGGVNTLEVKSRDARVHARLVKFETVDLMGLSPAHEKMDKSTPISLSRENNAPNNSQAEWAKSKQFKGILLKYNDLLKGGWSAMSNGVSWIRPGDWVLDAGGETSSSLREESYYVTIPGSIGWVWLTQDVRDEKDPPRGGSEEALVGLLHARDAKTDAPPPTESGMPLSLLETDPESISRKLLQYWILNDGWKSLTAGTLLIASTVLFIWAKIRRKRKHVQLTGGEGGE